MKKFFIILSILFLSCQSVFADEIKLTENTQLVEVEEAGGLALFQKQPVYQKQMQIIRVRKGGGITIIQINGKIKDSNNSKN